jgi:hypothetical protein
MGCYDTSPGQIGLRQLLPALLMLASAPASPVGPTWNMPGIQGNARDGAAPGINWTTNPREDSGGRWTAYHEVEGRFAPMVPGRAYGFLWALRESDDSFAPRNMLQGRRLQAASSDASHGRGPASLVTFTPARPGEFTVAIRGKLDIKQGAPTSMQLAFDVDAEKPWLLNLIMDGSFQGHRIFYYDVCLPTDGRETIVWRNRADGPGFGPASLAPEVAADIRREGSRTVYDIVFPWRSLGLDQAPPVGAQLGFSIVVNDSDKGHDRKFLRFGHGIAGPQNPEFFAILKIVAAGSGH